MTKMKDFYHLQQGVVISIILLMGSGCGLIDRELAAKPSSSKSPSSTPIAVTPTPSESPTPIVLPPTPIVQPSSTAFDPPPPVASPSPVTPSPTPAGSPKNTPLKVNTPDPKLSYEDQIQPEDGWQIIKTYRGSGMTNFCPEGDKFMVKSPWRLRWRIGQITNTKSGNGNMSIEIIDKTDDKTFPVLESSKDVSEATSQVFNAMKSPSCLLARGRSTNYTILVEKQIK
jgi:hypothetical protein